MKNITWMEVAVAMPMVLTFSSFGGVSTVTAAAGVMLLTMAAIKWGKQITLRRREVRMQTVKVRA